MYPTITQYAESISNPRGLFRTLGEPACERNTYGEPHCMSGGSAVVFKIEVAGERWALKCYTRPNERMREICRYFSDNDYPIVNRMRYLPQEVYVYDVGGRGAWYDAVLTRWVEGATLDYEIRRAIHYGDRDRMNVLAVSFDRMATELLSMPWAHGDLKPLNIVVEPSGNMRPIDFDAVFYPGSDGLPSAENGTPQYNHPSRCKYAPGKFIDDYPAAIISSTLHSIALQPSLADRFGTPDAFLFEPSAIMKGLDPGYKAARETAAKAGDSRLYALLSLLDGPSPILRRLKELLEFTPDANTYRPQSVPEPFREEEKWGYRCGHKVQILPLFDRALEFSEELAAVSLGGFNHFIDFSGKTVINGSSYDMVKPFCNGLAAVNRNGLWGYIDREGNEVVGMSGRTAHFHGRQSDPRAECGGSATGTDRVRTSGTDRDSIPLAEERQSERPCDPPAISEHKPRHIS